MYEWFEGRAAWAMGQQERSNPYRGVDNERFLAWAEGWLNAQKSWGKAA